MNARKSARVANNVNFGVTQLAELSVTALLSVGAFFVSTLVGLIMFSRLRAYRIDLKPEQDGYDGESKLPPVNYLSWANYSRGGRPLLAWFWVWHIFMLVLLVVIVDYLS
jgi:hypothetical protein